MGEYYDYFGKQLSMWISDVKVPKGLNKNNVFWLREYKDLYRNFKKANALLFFMVTEMDMQSLIRMMYSTSKVEKYISKVELTLKEKKVTTDYIPYFKKDYTQLKERLKTISLITKENLYLTDYYPYFEEKGFEILTDFENDGTAVEQLKVILDDFEQWKLNNPETLETHRNAIAKEKAAHEAHLKRIEESKKIEREAKKIARQNANAEVKEIRENERKHRAEYNKIERSFKRYYEGKC